MSLWTCYIIQLSRIIGGLWQQFIYKFNIKRLLSTLFANNISKQKIKSLMDL